MVRHTIRKNKCYANVQTYFVGFYNLSSLSITALDHNADILYFVLSATSDRKSRDLMREILDKNNSEPGLSMKRQVVFALGHGEPEEIVNLTEEQKGHNDLLMFGKFHFFH